MAFDLYTVSIGTYLQILPPIAGLIDKAEAHCRDTATGPEALTGACLATDMWPFAKQVTSVAHHSAGAVRGLRAGVFGPELDPAPHDFGELRARLADAIAFLKGIEADEINGMLGRDMAFAFGERRMEFTVEDFVLTFSLPNFYFHASTAYGVLRNQGLPIGKMDFLGQLRLKG